MPNIYPKILGVGVTGLVGSRIHQLLQKKYSFLVLGSKNGVDVTKPSSLKIVENEKSDSIVFHLAAKTDVDGCEKDKEAQKMGDAWNINVTGTQNVVNACKNDGKKIIYISTDFVFDGEQKPPFRYLEDDVPSPINWYGKTKYEGEKIVKDSGLPFLILRIAYPFRSVFPGKSDFVRTITSKLRNKEAVFAVWDHIISPAFIDDIANAVDKLIETNSTGVFHVVGSESLSPFEAAHLIANTFSLDSSLIRKTTREEFFKNRAPRPFNLSLKNDKIAKLGIKMKTFTEALEEVKKQSVGY